MCFQISQLLVGTLLITLCLCVSETAATAASKSKIESTSQSIVSRLNPALRRALLKALTNIETSFDNGGDSTDLSGIQTTTARDEELLEESTAADLKALNLYNTYLTDGVNFTQKSKDDNEIIHTIIVKAPTASTSSSAAIEQGNDPAKFSTPQNDQVIIQFGAPDPVKASDVHIETVQIARSVKTNEIDDDNNGHDDDDNDFKVTTYRPDILPSAITTTSTETAAIKTTTELLTHNEDGENIERVSKNDVKIYQAPLVAAFTVQQDALGLPKTVIPLITPIQQSLQANAKPIQEFSIRSSSTTVPPPQSTTATAPFTLQLPSENQAPSFTLSKSLELPSTKEAAFTTFALQQKRKQLEEQIALLQETFRQQQAYQEQQALNRQQELLLQQRYRFEEENRARLQQYEREQHLTRQNQFSNTQYLSQSLADPFVQIIPSLSFIPTQQLLPVREPNEFKPKHSPSFTPSQSFSPTFTVGQLASGPQLPIKSAQQFLSQPQPISSAAAAVPSPPPPSPSPPTSSFSAIYPSLNNVIDPITVSEQSHSRNRVFRQESNTGNFGLNSVNTNFPPIYPIYNVDTTLQNLLLQSGISSGRSNEDLNIISKVLALNHGISLRPSGTAQRVQIYPSVQDRFVRSISSSGGSGRGNTSN